MEKLAICVCTYKRPKMLTRCLESLSELETTSNFSIEIVVVNNETKIPPAALIADCGRNSSFPVHYCHQPKRGIGRIAGMIGIKPQAYSVTVGS